MGCGNTKEASSPAPRKQETNHHRKPSPVPPPRDPTPPPRDPTPPPKDPTPPPSGDHVKRHYNLMGGPGYFDTQEKEPTPVPRDPTPVPSPPPPPPPEPNDENENVVKDNESQGLDHDNQGANNLEGEDKGNQELQGESHQNDHIESQAEGQTNDEAINEPGHTDTEHKRDPDLDKDHLLEQNLGHQEDHGDHHGHQGHQDRGGQIGRKEGYNKSEAGIYERFLEFRPHPEPLDCVFAQEPNSNNFVDDDFGLSVAIKGERDLEWKRPKEFCSAPVLFSSGATRFDIGQGSAGTCWFLSTVAMLADKPEFFHRVVPKDAWNQECGYFYCFFWRYGEWERVVIDDFLPVIFGDQLWGAKSRDDPNEMWPALLEKAFARFHGNYNSIYGGQSGDAYLALTGGCSEYIDFEKDVANDPKALHLRLKNAITSGALICTEVPAEFDKCQGLIGGHAYSLSGARQVVNNQGEPIYLVRVRNPWGHTEWTGKWQDNGPEWSTIPKSELRQDKKDDGEFWMELRDFVKYFSGVTICSMTPDFDQDGCEDTLNCCTNMFGDWHGETAAGFQDRLSNPKFIFAVDDEGMDSDGLIPLVVQICQKLKHRQKDKASVRVDLYQVLAEHPDTGVLVLQLLGVETNVYKKERQMSARYKVEPGQYVAIPSTIDAGTEKEYLVRVFSPSGLTAIRMVDNKCSIMSSDPFEPPKVQGVDNKIRFSDCKVGSWRCNDNAGGQVSQQSFYQNPQVQFTVPDRGPQLVSITAMQSGRVKGVPVGCRLFELDEGYEIKKDKDHQQYLYDHYENSPQTTDGAQGAFIRGAAAQITHVLQPGKSYFALVHQDNMNTENDFAVLVRSTCALNLKCHNF